jgi:hypothetical protein
MDNERPIEKLLRRYAKKRRDDSARAGLKLHPATRRLLQGEVSRQFPKPAASGGAKPVVGLKSLWPRLVWALPVLIVLGVGVWAIVQSQRPKEGMGNLAQTESPSPVELNESLGRTEIPAQSGGAVPARKETVPVTLADAEASRAKDTSGFGLEEAKLKTDRAPASLAVNTPAPSATVPSPEVANLDKDFRKKLFTGRDALERLARDARPDRSRDLTLATRMSAEEPRHSRSEG